MEDFNLNRYIINVSVVFFRITWFQLSSYCFHNLILTSCYSFIDCRASQDFYIWTLFIQAHFHCLCTCVKNEYILSTSSTVFQLTIITLHLTKFIHTLPLDSRHSDNICKATYCYSVNTYQRNTLCWLLPWKHYCLEAQVTQVAT